MHDQLNKFPSPYFVIFIPCNFFPHLFQIFSIHFSICSYLPLFCQILFSPSYLFSSMYYSFYSIHSHVPSLLIDLLLYSSPAFVPNIRTFWTIYLGTIHSHFLLPHFLRFGTFWFVPIPDQLFIFNKFIPTIHQIYSFIKFIPILPYPHNHWPKTKPMSPREKVSTEQKRFLRTRRNFLPKSYSITVLWRMLFLEALSINSFNTLQNC